MCVCVCVCVCMRMCSGAPHPGPLSSRCSSTGKASLLTLGPAVQICERHHIVQQPGAGNLGNRALNLIRAERGEEILLRYDSLDGAPVSASKYVALVAKGADYDIFPSKSTVGLQVRSICPVLQAAVLTPTHPLVPVFSVYCGL